MPDRLFARLGLARWTRRRAAIRCAVWLMVLPVAAAAFGCTRGLDATYTDADGYGVFALHADRTWQFTAPGAGAAANGMENWHGDYRRDGAAVHFTMAASVLKTVEAGAKKDRGLAEMMQWAGISAQGRFNGSLSDGGKTLTVFKVAYRQKR